MLIVVSGSRFNKQNSGSDEVCVMAWEKALAIAGVEPTAIMHGKCPGSPDTVVGKWAREHLILEIPDEADWSNLDAPGAVVRKRRDGSLYNVRAGYDRNESMARFAETHGHEHGGSLCIALHDGVSRGTADMVERAKAHGIDVLLCTVDYKRRRLTHEWIRQVRDTVPHL